MPRMVKITHAKCSTTFEVDYDELQKQASLFRSVDEPTEYEVLCPTCRETFAAPLLLRRREAKE